MQIHLHCLSTYQVGHTCIHEGSYEAFSSYEAILEFLVKAVAATRRLGTRAVPEFRKNWSSRQFEEARLIRKFNLLAQGCIVVLTLTKKRREGAHQLRGWVGHPDFWEDGTHADNYGAKGIFEIVGDFEELREAADAHSFSPRRRRFEDDKYIVWI